MTEELEIIAERAGATRDTGGKWVRNDGFEKFAEMLINECIKFTDRPEELKTHFGLK